MLPFFEVPREVIHHPEPVCVFDRRTGTAQELSVEQWIVFYLESGLHLIDWIFFTTHYRRYLDEFGTTIFL